MNTEVVGAQLDGQKLYEQQKDRRNSSCYFSAPLVVADSLQIPENIGSILRLADAAGSKEVIFINDPSDQSFNRIRRTSRNCEASVPWKFSDREHFITQYPKSSYPLVAVELTTHSTNILETNLPFECIFIVGNERHGISSELLKHCDLAVHIPMYGVNGSMNVAHALAITLFEWRRQHSVPPIWLNSRGV
jgi:tRNA G18 (ribose-2'-O)-methylase SpoU